MTTDNSKQTISKWLGLSHELDDNFGEQLIKNACSQALLEVAQVIPENDLIELDQLLTARKEAEALKFLQTKIPNFEELVLRSGMKVLGEIKQGLV